ncbi:hypothetical protein GCM10023319_14740 [Nocardia iowensis]
MPLYFQYSSAESESLESRYGAALGERVADDGGGPAAGCGGAAFESYRRVADALPGVIEK